MSFVRFCPEIHRVFGIKETPVNISCVVSLSPWVKFPGEVLREHLPPGWGRLGLV